MITRSWMTACVFASYPQGKRYEAMRAADEYMVWVNSLPMKDWTIEWVCERPRGETMYNTIEEANAAFETAMQDTAGDFGEQAAEDAYYDLVRVVAGDITDNEVYRDFLARHGLAHGTE